MSKERLKPRFLKELEKGRGIISYACDNVGIARKTFYQWYEKDQKFKEKVDEINEAVVDRVESKLLNLINNEDSNAIIFYLKTKGKKRGYVEKTESDVNINAFEKLMQETDEDE